MPLKPHPTDPDKMVYVSRQYDIPQLQGVITQRTWVGLTDDELSDIWFKQSTDWMEFARAIEAAHGIGDNT